MLAAIFLGVGALLLTTPIWYALLMELLYRFGIGCHRAGQLRRIRTTEWLNATGVGILFGSICVAIGRTLQT